MKSERITILVTPDEKASINRRAAAMNIPAGELLRRAVADYEPDDEQNAEQLELLARQLAVAVTNTEAKLDKALDKLAQVRAALADAREDG